MSAFQTSMTPVLASLFPWLVALSVGSTVILLVALALCAIRRPPARSRVLVYRAAVVALVSLPLLSFLAWKVATPALRVPTDLVRFELPVHAPITKALDVGGLTAEGEPTDDGRSGMADYGVGAQHSNEAHARTVILIEPLVAVAAVGLWMAGVAILVLRLIIGLLMLARHRRSAEPVEPTLRSWARSRLHAGSRLKKLRILRGGPLSVPVCWGFRHATILLPTGSEYWAEERTHAVVEHELWHLHAGDAAFLVATRLAVAFHWLNPLAWFLQRLLERDTEEVCDKSVIEAGMNAQSYARALVATAREASRGERRSVQVAMARYGDLERRIQQILAGPPEPVHSLTGMVGAAVILVMTVATALVAAPPPKSTNLAETRQTRADTVSRAEMVEALVGALADPAPEVRRSAINSLRDIGDPRGLTQLEALLDDPDVDVRRAAEAVLGRRPAPTNLALPSSSPVQQPTESALDSIAELLSRPDFQTRLSAAQALGNYGSSASTAALVDVLDDEDPRVREAVVRALGHIGDPGSVAPLADAWPDADGHVRAGIVSALGEIGKPGAAGVVIRALEDHEAHVRHAAAEALGKLGRAATDEPVPANPGTPTTPDGSADTSPPVLPLASPLPARNREPGLATVPDVCRDRLDPGDAPSDLATSIRTLLEDPDPLLRERAAWSIGARAPSPADVEEMEKDHHHALIAGLSDPAQGVRLAAACGLGKLGDERALEFLTLRSKDPESVALRRAARWAVDMIATRSQ